MVKPDLPTKECFEFDINCEISNRYTLGWLPVCGDNPYALASGLSLCTGLTNMT